MGALGVSDAVGKLVAWLSTFNPKIPTSNAHGMTALAYKMSHRAHCVLRSRRNSFQAPRLSEVTRPCRAQRRALQISTKPSEGAVPIDTLLSEPLAPTAAGSPGMHACMYECIGLTV